MKKPSDSDKTGNEGIQRIPAKTVRGAGLILLFDGEVGPRCERSHGRAQTNRYSDSEPRASLPPSQHLASGTWEFVVRYSGATVPDSNGVP
jgi:hypothetical protein